MDRRSSSPDAIVLILLATSVAAPLLAGNAPDSTRPASAPGQEVTWSLSSDPTLRIGRVAGDDDYLFADVADVLRRPDGTIVVADNGGPNVRFYDEDGGFLHSVGGPGDGPGEFQFILGIGECRLGEIHVHDGVHDRITVVDGTGDLMETYSVRLETPGFRPHRVYCDGRGILLTTGQRAEPPREPGSYRTELTVEVADTRGRPLRVLGRFTGDERYRFRLSDGPRPLGRRTVLAAGSDRWFLGTGDQNGIRVFDFEGGEVGRFFPLPSGPRPLTGERIERFIQRSVAPIDDPDARAREVRRWRDHDFPATLPPYDRLLVDDEGLLWVRDHPDLDGDPDRWWIFDPAEGELVADLSTPAELEVTRAGSDWVIGIWRGDFGVEQIRMYRLVRGSDRGAGP